MPLLTIDINKACIDIHDVIDHLVYFDQLGNGMINHLAYFYNVKLSKADKNYITT